MQRESRTQSETTKEPGTAYAKRVSNALGFVCDPKMKQNLARSYQPMTLSVLVAVTIYFILITVAHYFDENTTGFVLLGGISSIIAVTCALLFLDVRSRKLTFGELEFRAFIVFGLIYFSLAAHHLYHLEPAKLIYFLFLALVMSTLSVSIRLSLLTIFVTITTTILFAAQAGPEVRAQYSLIGLAGSLVAFCMAALTRSAIKKQVNARMTSDELRRTAEKQAVQDMLTELPNRRSFFRELDARFKRRRDNSPAFAMALIDLDGFKTVNDTFGHSVGDTLLVELSGRLQDFCGERRWAARLGGDEFALIIDEADDLQNLQGLGETIREKLGRPYMIMGIPVSVSASVGFAVEHFSVFTGTEMIEGANYALHRAKENKSGIVVFTRELEEDRRSKWAMEHNLRHCDRDEEMHVAFQPKVDAVTGRTVGFEALARWNNRELGPVRPDLFIAAAERIGVIEELTGLFLAKALHAAREWPDTLTLAFNLSIRDILSRESIENVCRIVRESGFPPERIEFEVTENLIITDFEQAHESVRMLHALGARVALDDFGVGYANFGNIDRLNINTIKIDRSFVTRLDDSGGAVKVLKTMIDMCSNLEIECVVEGVETTQELAILKRIGARYLQGYHFSKPMPGDEVAAWLARELADSIGGAPALSARTG